MTLLLQMNAENVVRVYHSHISQARAAAPLTQIVSGETVIPELASPKNGLEVSMAWPPCLSHQNLIEILLSRRKKLFASTKVEAKRVK